MKIKIIAQRAVNALRKETLEIGNFSLNKQKLAPGFSKLSRLLGKHGKE